MSSGRSALTALRKRAELKPELIFAPVDVPDGTALAAAGDWYPIFAAVSKQRYEPGWRCSHLFDVSADWLSLLATAAGFNRDEPLKKKVFAWNSVLVKVADTRRESMAWALQAHRTNKQLAKLGE